MGKLKAIFFDFDGTLANTAPGILRTMEASFREMNLPVPAEKDILDTIGLPLVKAFKILGSFDQQKAEEATEIYRRLFTTYEVTNVSIFPNVKETLELFHSEGIRMAICTSRDKMSLEMILGNYGMIDFFETIATVNNGLTPKPAPDMVLFLLDKMNIDKDDAIVVGDTTFDIDMGNNAGCKTCAVTYGNQSREVLTTSNPTFMIDQFCDLSGIVKSLI